MTAVPAPQVLPDDAVVVSVLGCRYVFATREEARAFMNAPMTEAEAEQMRAVLSANEEHRRSILARTGGVGISEDLVDEVVREVRKH